MYANNQEPSAWLRDLKEELKLNSQAGFVE